ncbi:MAG TPA: outer membrane lipoprotein-sorting protein [Elusimicrobiales bacterium]|nr:outer membrane lipoprotein-sorting protein [Elusimicrobiales bacterium]
MIKAALASFLMFFALAPGFCAGGRVMPVLKAIDENYKMKKDVRADVTLTQQRVGQGTKIIDMGYFRRDSDDAFLISMNSPENEKGNGYLRVGDNFWMYRKNTRTFQHVNRDESIGGTDAHSDDFESRKLSELYAPVADSSGTEKFSEEMLGKVPVFRFEIKATVNDVDYPRQIFWTRRDNNLLLKQESYSLSGTLMQTAYFLKFTEIEGRFVPVKQFFIDEFEKGNKTIVEIANMVPGKLDDKIFTKAYLENLSK